MSNHAIIHTDGGARGNPGPAGIGVVIEYEGKKHEYKKFIGHATNNQAEYQAVLLGLEKAKSLGATVLDFYLDSELVVEQLNRRYKVKDQALGQLFVRVWNELLAFNTVTFRHVPRSENKVADRLVNEVLDEQS